MSDLRERLRNLAAAMTGAVQRDPHPDDPSAYPLYIMEQDAADVAAAVSLLAGLETEEDLNRELTEAVQRSHDAYNKMYELACTQLERYGSHHPDCYWLDPGDPSEGCNCGWAQRIKRLDLDRDPENPGPPLEGTRVRTYQGDDGLWDAVVHLSGTSGHKYGARTEGLALQEALTNAVINRGTDK